MCEYSSHGPSANWGAGRHTPVAQPVLTEQAAGGRSILLSCGQVGSIRQMLVTWPCSPLHSSSTEKSEPLPCHIDVFRANTCRISSKTKRISNRQTKQERTKINKKEKTELARKPFFCQGLSANSTRRAGKGSLAPPSVEKDAMSIKVSHIGKPNSGYRAERNRKTQ